MQILFDEFEENKGDALILIPDQKLPINRFNKFVKIGNKKGLIKQI